MSAAVITPAQLAEMLDVTEAKVMEWRRTYRWPSFKIGRKVRFTTEHVELIIAAHSVDAAEPATAPRVVGQTARSARRRRSA